MHSEDEKVYTDEQVALYMELIRVANEYTGHVFSIDLDRSMLFHTTYEYGDGLMLISVHNKQGNIELCSSYRGASPIPDEPYRHICELFDRMVSFCLDEYGGSFIIYGSPISFDPDLFWKYSESFGYILAGFIDSFEDTVDAVCETLEDSYPSEGPSDKDSLGKAKLIEQGIADLFNRGYQPDLTRANVYAALDKLLRDPIWVESPPDVILDDIRPIIVLLD